MLNGLPLPMNAMIVYDSLYVWCVVDELELWIKEKLKVASEESWKDLSNLSAKLQKHQAFEAEVIGHKYVLDQLDNSGEGMIEEQHFAKDIIRVSHIPPVAATVTDISHYEFY